MPATSTSSRSVAAPHAHRQRAEEPRDLGVDDGAEHGVLAAGEDPVAPWPGCSRAARATSSRVVLATPWRAMHDRAPSMTRTRTGVAATSGSSSTGVARRRLPHQLQSHRTHDETVWLEMSHCQRSPGPGRPTSLGQREGAAPAPRRHRPAARCGPGWRPARGHRGPSARATRCRTGSCGPGSPPPRGSRRPRPSRARAGRARGSRR